MMFLSMGFHQECEKTMDGKIVLLPNTCKKTMELIVLVWLLTTQFIKELRDYGEICMNVLVNFLQIILFSWRTRSVESWWQCGLFALHYVLCISDKLSSVMFQNGWNNHEIQTERNQSPDQLFVAGELMLIVTVWINSTGFLWPC